MRRLLPVTALLLAGGTLLTTFRQASSERAGRNTHAAIGHARIAVPAPGEADLPLPSEGSAREAASPQPAAMASGPAPAASEADPRQGEGEHTWVDEAMMDLDANVHLTAAQSGVARRILARLQEAGPAARAECTDVAALVSEVEAALRGVLCADQVEAYEAWRARNGMVAEEVLASPTPDDSPRED